MNSTDYDKKKRHKGAVQLHLVMNTVYTLKHRVHGHIGYVPKFDYGNAVIFGFEDRKSAQYVLQRLKYKDVLTNTKLKPPHTYTIDTKQTKKGVICGPLNKKYIDIEMHDPFDLNTYLFFNSLRLCMIDDIRESHDSLVLKGSLLAVEGFEDKAMSVAILNHLFQYDKTGIQTTAFEPDEDL